MDATLNKMISPVKSPKAYLLIVEKIVSLVARGELKYGEQLYTENDLMATLNVSRPTLREALRVLEFLGVVSVSPRKGISINNPSNSNYYLSLLYIMMFEKTTNFEIFQLRRAVQTEMVAIAAKEASDKELAELSALVDMMEQQLTTDYISFEKLDYDFHMQIIVCAHNTLCLKLMQTMSAVIHTQMQERLRRMPIEDRNRTLSFHKKICEALLARDCVSAKRLMEEHMENVYHHLGDTPVQFDFNEMLF